MGCKSLHTRLYTLRIFLPASLLARLGGQGMPGATSPVAQPVTGLQFAPKAPHSPAPKGGNHSSSPEVHRHTEGVAVPSERGSRCWVRGGSGLGDLDPGRWLSTRGRRGGRRRLLRPAGRLLDGGRRHRRGWGGCGTHYGYRAGLGARPRPHRQCCALPAGGAGGCEVWRALTVWLPVGHLGLSVTCTAQLSSFNLRALRMLHANPSQSQKRRLLPHLSLADTALVEAARAGGVAGWRGRIKH